VPAKVFLAEKASAEQVKQGFFRFGGGFFVVGVVERLIRFYNFNRL
jgi:hypothetical protein